MNWLTMNDHMCKFWSQRASASMLALLWSRAPGIFVSLGLCSYFDPREPTNMIDGKITTLVDE
ncbi:uncharacterized protein RAG0_13461 [Rhynchosporium agropyri]|uniref:Uncharacterized protein n=1 Tax=Rhynchosporium agropyri TaxID=914238 RepID=A0A1E1LCV0_9HELO|nr:uncharacterized protein RAG0_13461 [Rhynchosporium agropyri]